MLSRLSSLRTRWPTPAVEEDRMAIAICRAGRLGDAVLGYDSLVAHFAWRRDARPRKKEGHAAERLVSWLVRDVAPVANAPSCRFAYPVFFLFVGGRAVGGSLEIVGF